MKKRLLFLLTISATFAMVATGCKDKEVVVNSAEDIQDITTAVTDSDEAQELTGDELSFFTDYYNEDPHNGFVRTAYNTPESIKWDDVLYNGEGGKSISPDSPEGKEILKDTDPEFFYTDVCGIKKSDIEDFVMKYTGSKYEDAKKPLTWPYLKDADLYYSAHGDCFKTKVKCTEGKKNGDVYVLTFEPTNEEGYNQYSMPRRQLTAIKKGDDYQAKSCVFLWDEQCIENQSFDIDMEQYSGQCHFYSYPSTDSDGCSMLITEDGVEQAWLSSSRWNDDGQTILKSIDAVGMFDYDGDAMTDVAVIGQLGDEQHLLLYHAEPGGYFYDMEGLSSMVEVSVDSLTIPDVKKFLLIGSKDGKYTTYQDAYSQIARLYNFDKPAQYSFDLINLDGDDVPELVCDLTGYSLDVFTYKDGHVKPLIDDYGYGAMGNAGYDYAPGKNVVRNYNQDYAGLIMYTSYLTPTGDPNQGYNYQMITYNWQDTNNDGFVDGDEDQTFLEEPYSVKYTGGDESESKIKAKIDEYSTYDFQPISGRYNVTELDQALGLL
jgi:hypothetical protein